MKQVGEWCHNKTPVEGQVRTLREILKEIEAYEPEKFTGQWKITQLVKFHLSLYETQVKKILPRSNVT